MSMRDEVFERSLDLLAASRERKVWKWIFRSSWLPGTQRIVEECFGSIREETRVFRLKTVVVDNASTDGTADLIAERFPEVKLIRSPKNLGFPGGNVVAIQASSPCEIRLFESILTFGDAGMLRNLMKYMEEHAEVGVVGPLTRNPDGTIQRSCMRSPTCGRRGAGRWLWIEPRCSGCLCSAGS